MTGFLQQHYNIFMDKGRYVEKETKGEDERTAHAIYVVWNDVDAELGEQLWQTYQEEKGKDRKDYEED